MIYVAPGNTFETVTEGFPTGLAGTIGVRLIDNEGTTVIARTTVGIIETIAGSGIYAVTLTAPADAGQYSVIWDDGTVSPSTTASEDVTVTASAQINLSSDGNYITEAELKSARSLNGYTFADGEIPRTIGAASRVVDKFCGQRRRFYLDADANQVRVYTAANPRQVIIDDLVQITSLKTDLNNDGVFEITWSASDYILSPFNAAADSKPYESIRHRHAHKFFPCGEACVQVTGQFGWPAIPTEVAQATLLIASRYLTRTRDATFGIVATGGQVEGSMMRLAQTDPDVPGLLKGFNRKSTFV